MTARDCLNAKINAGTVPGRAGRDLLRTIEQFEQAAEAKRGRTAAALRTAHEEAAEAAIGDAARRLDHVNRTIRAQADMLDRFATTEARMKELRASKGDFGFGNKAPPGMGKDSVTTLGVAARSLLAPDAWDVGRGANVAYTNKALRAEGHRTFIDAIETLRAKALGWKEETELEIDFLRAAHDGRGDVPDSALGAATAWRNTEPRLVENFRAVGGALAKRENYFPNPGYDRAKTQALGLDRFRRLVAENVDRDKVIDFTTDKPMADARFAKLVDEAYAGIVGEATAAPGTGGGQPILANARELPRLFVWKNADSWMRVAETIGEHASPYQSALEHINVMARDTAMLDILGPNPEAMKRFVLDLFDREAARLSVTAATDDTKALKAATRKNMAIEARVALERRSFEKLWAEVTGENRIAVSSEIAKNAGDVRHVLGASQLGSAILTAFTDPVTMAAAARMWDVPAMDVVKRWAAMIPQKGAEIEGAQLGLTADSMAHLIGAADRLQGEAIRTGVAAKLSSTVMRAQGLRRYTAIGRVAFGMELQARIARDLGTNYADLNPTFRQALDRAGIGEAEWGVIRQATPDEPRPNALFMTPDSVARLGTPEAARVSTRLSELIHRGMDFAVIEADPRARAILIGQSQPGTVGGEARRFATQYRTWPASFMTTHLAFALSRGWDGSRLGYGAATFIAMSALGALSMQAKHVAQGRDPVNMNPTTAIGARAWAGAILQGGGLGVFGDIAFVDQTRYGNTWAATIAGPAAGLVEAGLGDFLIRNVQRAAKGDETHFLGDALYIGGRYVPGSSLWYTRLAFQRGVLDQAAIMIDPRARERFSRMEETAQREWGQRYWMPPGRTEPRRAPDLTAAFGP